VQSRHVPCHGPRWCAALDRLVGPGFEDLHAAGLMPVARADGSREVPVHVRKTVHGQGRDLATTALRMALVIPPWKTIFTETATLSPPRRRSQGGGASPLIWGERLTCRRTETARDSSAVAPIAGEATRPAEFMVVSLGSVTG